MSLNRTLEMLSSLLIALHVSVVPAPAATLLCESPAMESPVATADSTLQALYASGVDFDAFLAAARARREQWDRNWKASEVPADILAAAQALPGRWRMLVIAVDGCSDSVNTVPYLARLAALVPTIELRVISPDAGRALQEARRTPDGRAATPTVILLNGDGREVGCLIERPSNLVRMGAEARAAGTYDDFIAKKQAWYTNDAGHSTVREVVEMLTAAAAGETRCAALRPADGG